MAILAGTFLVVALLTAGPYWWYVLRPERRTRTGLFARLSPRVDTPVVAVMRRPDRMSAIPALDRLLRHRARLAAPLERLRVEADVEVSGGTLVLGSCTLGAAGWSAAWTGGWPAAAGVALGLVAASLPWAWIVRRRALRLARLEAQFPEAMDVIARALRAGHAFTAALALAGDELPAPLGTEFRRLHDEHAFGLSLDAALGNLATRVPFVDARFFVTAVNTQRESGGNLAEVLDGLARVIRDRFTLRRQIRVISAHGRISAWVLACLPPVLAGVLFVLSPRFMRVLLDDPLGPRLMTAALGLELLGTIVILRLVRPEY